ncbi:MAG: amino acid decarboxylase [Leifsonia sp.]|nr:amino acid decarboxylase [Leifsonia sp.]
MRTAVDTVALDAQTATPYASAVRDYSAAHPVRYHLPGHGGGTAGPTAIGDFYGRHVAELDIMPMIHGVDLGAEPTPLTRSRRLAAEAWGARNTWFLTNGASQGNQMAIMALKAFGDTLLVQRSVHSSVVDGLMMSGMRAHFVSPVVDAELGAAQAVTAGAIGEGLKYLAARGQLPAAVYLVSPSYFGFVTDIAEIAEIVHRAGVPLVVDEAWGSHLGFHPRLPKSALAHGADLVISSTHKLGGSLTQSAMLHLAEGPWADRLEERLDRVKNSLQSTSESSLLLASLDLARRSLATRQDRLGHSIAAADRIRDEVRETGRFAVATDRYAAQPGWGGTDPLKVVIDTRAGGIGGHHARALLHRQAGILVELATENAIVAIVGSGTQPDTSALLDALHALPRLDDTAAGVPPMLPGWGPALMSIREAYFAPADVVPVHEAIGRISADSLAAYPPGIPNVLPGEEIVAETVTFLRAVAASPAGHVRGAVDPALDYLRVVAEASGGASA